jgi:hypothetical protein
MAVGAKNYLVHIHPTMDHTSIAAVEVVTHPPLLHSKDATPGRTTTRATGTPPPSVMHAAALKKRGRKLQHACNGHLP